MNTSRHSSRLLVTSNAREFSRRRFLKGSAVGCALVSIVPSGVLFGADTPNSRVTLAGVGIGGVGNGQLQECEQAGFHIAALCDVDQQYGKKSFDRWPQARRYKDFREMLASEGDKIDAVYCGTPDHTHALITLAALRLNKHVCCVKPLTRTIGELRVIAAAARQARVATQVTAAPNTGEDACRVCEIIQAGVLGSVRELHLWSNRPVWPQGMMRPPGDDPVPADFDWKLWLGPAPVRPFKANWAKDSYAMTQMNLKDWDPGVQGVYHPFNFRGWWDFGSGALGDMGCHHFNTPYRALKLGAPVRVEASASKVFSESAPLASMVTLEFPARAEMPALKAIWYDGGLRPAQPRVFAGQPWPAEGTMYVGERGCLYHGWDGIRLAPEALNSAAAAVPKSLERQPGTWKEWHIACRGGQPAGCNFELAEPLTEMVLLGNAALRSGRPLDWDSKAGKFTNHEPANQFIREPYHNGWSLDS